MNTDAIATVSESIVDRRERVRTAIRTLAAEQVANRREYNGIKNRYRNDAEFRAEMSVHDVIRYSPHYEIPSALSKYELLLMKTKSSRWSRRRELRALNLATAWFRGHPYKTAEPISELHTHVLAAEGAISRLAYDEVAVIRAVAEAVDTTPEAVIAWILGLP